VRDLVRDQPEVRGYLQNRFTHLFIDEFQDTDPLQAEILLLLGRGRSGRIEDWTRVRPKPGKLFLVGDPKQSIYKFRRADMVLYRQIRGRLGWRRGFVNLADEKLPRRAQHPTIRQPAFETEMTGDAASGQADWAPLEEHRPDVEGRPSVIVLPVPRPYKTRVAKKPSTCSLPDAIAAFIAWLVKMSGWQCESIDGYPADPRATSRCCSAAAPRPASGSDARVRARTGSARNDASGWPDRNRFIVVKKWKRCAPR
jgi:ATP-dependent helicase/nuclease subunit A